MGGSGLWEHHKAPGKPRLLVALPFALFHFVFNSSQFHCPRAGPPPRKTRRRSGSPLPSLSSPSIHRLIGLRNRDPEFIGSFLIENREGQLVDESADSEFAILFLFLFLRLRKLKGLSIDKKQWKDGDDF